MVAGQLTVTGEVYEATLAALDRREGHPRWYRRTPVTLEDGAVVAEMVRTGLSRKL